MENLMEIKQIEPSKFRRYFYEYSIFGLIAAVIYLFLQVNNLNEFIRDNLTTQRIELTKAVQENTEALKKFNNKLNN